MTPDDATNLYAGVQQPGESEPLRIGLISNPRSGKNRTRLHSVETILAQHPRILHRITLGANEISAVLRDFAGHSVHILAINGGDGTIAEVLTRLFEEKPFPDLPYIALLPGGTTNMNVGDVGLHGRLLGAVNRLCHYAETPRRDLPTSSRAVLRVTLGDDNASRYGMFFGAGAIIQGIEYCHKHLHSRGVGNEVGPGLAMARTVWGMVRRDPRFTRPVTARIGLDGQPCGASTSLRLLLVSTLERLFLGMKPYWGTEDGTLHVSMIRHDARHFLRAFPSLLRGRPNRFVTPETGYRSHNINTLCLDMDGTFTLDGEMYSVDATTGPVTLSSAGELAFVR